MSDLALPFAPDGPGEVDRPAANRLIAGDPVFTTWDLEERDGLFAGIWQSTPGKWRVAYDEWEYFNILSGHSILTEDDKPPVHLRAGDRMIIRPGFKGRWEVVETTVKDYVIRV
ncbi:cupin domain-containing protein [Aliiroseovarius subalbicans]|uniref:cupin domain-containing protein n=1 Tax=Aliiroseovarius subalbicans TaxID=2925840 RepID=UPI001F589361|nr:cupin domain-containing protein [Aliiroseovarius subalbicans]MCI2398879.1 cupin domain-containing protein [Aliiroseovarius subalbicans]